MVRALLASLFALVSAAADAQSIVKCVDSEGNVTYQDAPCSKGTAGRSVELPKAEPREDTSAWEEAARSARVLKGMPKRWVLRSRGAPDEIRPPGAREDATEVWRYEAKDGALLVGFAGPSVAWTRIDTSPPPKPAAKPPAPNAPTAAAAAPPGASIKGAQNRKFVLPGRYCEHVFAEIGAADREEPLEVTQATPGAEGGKGVEAPKRYFYDPAAGDPSMRTVFTCIDGKVADVERTLVP
ncbi:MAG: DUF4124 domain-containing protein [Burkholderiales bacterium]